MPATLIDSIRAVPAEAHYTRDVSQPLRVRLVQLTGDWNLHTKLPQQTHLHRPVKCEVCAAYGELIEFVTRQLTERGHSPKTK